MIGLALRTLLRYLVPLAIVSTIVAAPVLLVAYRARWPHNMATANAAMLRASLLAATGWMLVLVLVAAAAPLVRSLSIDKPLSQLAATRAALANMLRMLLPCVAAIGAVLVGGLALVVPALVLLVALSLTGTSEERGMPAPLVDSVQAVRARWKLVAVIVFAILAVDAALVLGAWKLATVPFAKKLAPQQWATYGNVARIVAIGVFATAPIFATLLAAARVKR